MMPRRISAHPVAPAAVLRGLAAVVTGALWILFWYSVGAILYWLLWRR